MTNIENFANTRCAWQSAIALAGDLFPAVIKDIKRITVKNVVRRINENILKYLENLGIEKPEMIVPESAAASVR